MNQWMTKPFQYPDQPMDRGKVLWEADLEQMKDKWGRYRDLDGDGISYRSLPGNSFPGAAYFARGTGHDPDANYSEDPANWHHLLEQLKRKYETSRKFMPEPIIDRSDGAEIGLITYGSTEPAVKEACHILLKQGIKVDLMRIRAVPFNETINEFIQEHSHNYVIEMNRDGQMHQLLTLEYPGSANKLISIAFTDGLPLTARFVCESILAKENN
jgi:2-oxoglutarate ferredoxin oxidoreductase subunit alpha